MKVGGLIQWNAIAIYEMFKTSWQMEKHLLKGDVENHLKDRSFRPVITFGAMVEYQSVSANILRICIDCGEILERRYFGCGRWGAGIFGRVRNSCPKAQRKESKYAEEWWKFHIPNRRWNSKIVWKRSWNPKIHSEVGPSCKEWKSHRRPSGKFGEVSTSRRNKRWRWSPQWFLVDRRGFNLTPSRGTSHQKIMKIASRRKGSIRWVTAVWCTNLFLCSKRWKFLQQMQRWTRNGRTSKSCQRRNWPKWRAKRRFFWKAEKRAKHSPFCYVDGHLSSKNAELVPKYQKYNGRVVLRGDRAKADSGAYVVFTAQGSSASQMTDAVVMDVIARLPDCDGQAADAASAYTQVKLENSPRLLTNPIQNFQRFAYVYQNTSDQNHGHILKISWFFLSEMCTDTHFQASCGTGSLRNWLLLSLGWEEVPNWECLFVHRKSKDYSCRKTWTTSKLVEESRIWLPCRRDWSETWKIDEHTSLLDHVYLDVLNANSNQTKILLTSTEKWSNHEFLLEQLKNCQGGWNLAQKVSRGHTTWKDMRKSA